MVTSTGIYRDHEEKTTQVAKLLDVTNTERNGKLESKGNTIQGPIANT